METWLQSPLAPFAIALVIAGLGLLAWRAARRWAGAVRISLRILGGVLTALGLVLLFGAGVTAYKLNEAARRFPAPGKIVAVGEDRVHVWCEGPKASPTVLLMGGGYSQGLHMRFYQIKLRDRWRACTVDRPGLGWSKAGRLPKTVFGDMEVVHGALAAAGEKPASVVVGHSAGGQFAANYASVYTREVKAIALFDPSEPGHALIDWRQVLTPWERFVDTWRPIVGTMYGLSYVPGVNPLLKPDAAPVKIGAADHWDALVAWELRPSSILSNRSYRKATNDPLSFVRTPGRLEGVSILLMPQQPNKPIPPDHATGWRFENYAKLMAYTRTEYSHMSSKSVVVTAPPDVGHYFLMTRPDFALPLLVSFLEREAPPAVGTTAPPPPQH